MPSWPSPAEVIGRPDYGRIAPGAPAHLVVFEAQRFSELLSRPCAPRRCIDGVHHLNTGLGGDVRTIALSQVVEPQMSDASATLSSRNRRQNSCSGDRAVTCLPASKVATMLSPLSTGTRSLTAGDMVIPSTNHNAVGGSPEPLQHLVL